MNQKIKKEIEKILVKSRVLFNEPMCKHTSLRIGGSVDVFVIVEDVSELKRLLTFIRRKKIPFFVIGAGTNLLVRDGGVKGVVIKPGRAFEWIKFRGKKVLAGCSTPLVKLLNEISRRGLSGLEFIAGIPGTIGGAIIANAGFPHRAIGDFVSSVKFMAGDGKIIVKKRKNMHFSYRFSSFRNERGVILEVALNSLKNRSRREIRKQIALLLKKKKETQPLGSPSAGCIFKNPPITSAGILIDFAGLKGAKIGGARISNKHANFIINENRARSTDLLMLIKKIKKRIYDLFHIRLELEIELIGRFSK